MSRRNRRWRKHRNAVIKPWAPSTYGTNNLGHVVLIGDSIFDNSSYTEGKPDVAQRLYGNLGDDWKVTLLASDGATTGSLSWQMERFPEDATHLVVSVGGNNANGEWKMLRDPEQFTMREALDKLSMMAYMFELSYIEAMNPLLETGLPLTIATIYDPDFTGDDRFPALTALALFNDVILRYALAHDLGILDLRTVCNVPEDFEMQIEPSAIGGAKIARAIANTLPYFASDSVTA
jgi:hypothetical protein